MDSSVTREFAISINKHVEAASRHCVLCLSVSTSDGRSSHKNDTTGECDFQVVRQQRVHLWSTVSCSAWMQVQPQPFLYSLTESTPLVPTVIPMQYKPEEAIGRDGPRRPQSTTGANAVDLGVDLVALSFDVSHIYEVQRGGFICSTRFSRQFQIGLLCLAGAGAAAAVQKKTSGFTSARGTKPKRKGPNPGKLSKYMKNITKGVGGAQKHTCATKLAAGERHRPVLAVGYWRCEHLQEKMGHHNYQRKERHTSHILFLATHDITQACRAVVLLIQDQSKMTSTLG